MRPLQGFCESLLGVLVSFGHRACFVPPVFFAAAAAVVTSQSSLPSARGTGVNQDRLSGRPAGGSASEGPCRRVLSPRPEPVVRSGERKLDRADVSRLQLCQGRSRNAPLRRRTCLGAGGAARRTLRSVEVLDRRTALIFGGDLGRLAVDQPGF